MLLDTRHLAVIEARAPDFCLVEHEPERMHEVQAGADVGAKTDDIARIRGNLRLIEDQVEHDNREVDSNTDLSVNFCGLTFASPIVLLSGCVGFGEEYTRVKGFSNRDVGAIVLKGTTLAPRLGNEPHRVWETPAGMLNAIGLQNPGARVVVDEILPRLDFSETRFIANVCGSTVEEYVEVTRIFDQSPIDAIEINISCPNVKEGGVAFGNYPDMSAEVVSACRAVTDKPLITKLSPNQTDIAANARACIDAGSDALSVINTLMGMAIDVEQRTPIIGNVQGGLSGPAIRPIALLKVFKAYAEAGRSDIPIIGQGGIETANDALEFILAGSAAVGVGTALFYDPLVVQKINRGIASYLDRHGLESVADLVGRLQSNESLDRAVSG
jgi:dihydroorotate dehydrogenase (NAD+) catalytic subunit